MEKCICVRDVRKVGNTVRAKHIGKDIMAGLKSIVGGELHGYSEMLADARAESMSRMADDAKRLDADAVVNVRFTTSQRHCLKIQ